MIKGFIIVCLAIVPGFIIPGMGGPLTGIILAALATTVMPWRKKDGIVDRSEVIRWLESNSPKKIEPGMMDHEGSYFLCGHLVSPVKPKKFVKEFTTSKGKLFVL